MIAYLLTPSTPKGSSAFFSPFHITFHIDSPLRMQRTQIAGNTNVKKLPVLVSFGELAPGLGFDDRMVKVEARELGRACLLGVFTVEARVVAEGAPSYGGRRRGELEDWCYCGCD